MNTFAPDNTFGVFNTARRIRCIDVDEVDGVFTLVKIDPLTGNQCLLFWLTDGTKSEIVLPISQQFHLSGHPYARLVPGAGDSWDLYLFAMNGAQCVFQHMVLDGDPLPETITSKAANINVGTANSRNGAIARMADGAIILSWWQTHLDSITNEANFYYARFASGTLGTPLQVAVPSSTGSNLISLAAFPMAVHPADQTLWSFAKRDSFTDCIRVKLSITGGVPTLVNANNVFISQGVDGLNAPEGETPPLHALADPATNVVWLAYLNTDFTIFDAGPPDGGPVIIKGTGLTACKIAADGTKTFYKLDVKADNYTTFGFTVQDGNPVFIYELALSPEDLWMSKHNGTTWDAPVKLSDGGNERNSPKTVGLNALSFGPQALPYECVLVNTLAEDPIVPESIPGDTTAPSIPQNVTATGSGTHVILSWRDSTDSGGAGLLGYRCYRDNILFATVMAPATRVRDSALPFGKHVYQVKAFDAATPPNVSLPSKSVEITVGPPIVQPPRPTIPVLSPAVVNGTSVTLNWTESTDVGGPGLAGYRVYRNWVLKATVAPGTLTYADTNVPLGGWTYTVVAVDTAGLESGISGVAGVTIL